MELLLDWDGTAYLCFLRLRLTGRRQRREALLLTVRVELRVRRQPTLDMVAQTS
jgi:hypothetical protein